MQSRAIVVVRPGPGSGNGWVDGLLHLLFRHFEPPRYSVSLIDRLENPNTNTLYLMRDARVLGGDICWLAIVPPEGESSDHILEIMAAGAGDYVCEPIRALDLVPRVRRLADTLAMGAGETKRYPGIVGNSMELRKALYSLERVAACDATCLITGETGTGKELFARTIHYSSARRNGPFVPVNCGAIPELLFENELFGHVRGAYTDARQPVEGLVSVAEGGTLFLDEVDALSPASQVKMLRLLQEREYRPLGSAQARRADIRLIAATNANLRLLSLQRSFRDDLYYRMNTIELRIPALHARASDVPLLAAAFVERYAAEHRRGSLRLHPSAIAKLMQYTWPGNIRELQTVLQRAVILAPAGAGELTARDLALPAGQEQEMPDCPTLRNAKHQASENFERAYLVRLLEQHNGNVSRSAKAAGKERRTFQRLLQKHAIDRESFARGR